MANLDSLLSNLSSEEYESTMKILQEISKDGKSDTLNALYNKDYEEVPVDIIRFITDERYIGKFTGNGTLIYPYWKDQFVDIFSDMNKYQEIALTGAIGVGKSTVACIMMSYLLYCTMCLRDPQRYYKLAAGSTIVFAFFNNTLDLTTSVGYGTIQSILQSSPWFLERGTVTGTKYKEYNPYKLIRFRVGSQASHALGANVISAMIDEVNFKQGANVRMEQSKIMETYNGVLERMGSRFMVNGKIAGKLFIVSSKKSEYDFLESYIKKRKDDPSVKICDAKLWEVKPLGTYSGKTFRVAVGGSNMPSRIIPDDEQSEPYIRMGYDIIEPPLEFKGRFEMDINAALMNIAGISVSHVTKFITFENLSKNYMGMHQPFQSNILKIGTKDSLKIQDFFVPELIPSELYSKPIFIHLDCSLTGDRTGIGAVAAIGYRYQNEYDINNGQIVPTKELLYRQLFTIGIECPPGAEISFQKSRDFIYYLKNELHWNIKGISTDGFQSSDLRQQLITMGFEDTTLVSLDRTPTGYLALKSAINEQRIKLYNIDELEVELIRLEQDNMSGKVDHPPVDGSKDLADGLCGAMYNASLHDSAFTFDLSDRAQTFTDTNYAKSNIDYRDRFLDSMVPKKFDPSDIDYSLFNMQEDKNKPKEVLDEIQKAHPEMSLKDAVANYLEEVKGARSKVEISNDDKSVKKTISNEDIYNEWQNIRDMNDGILFF